MVEDEDDDGGVGDGGVWRFHSAVSLSFVFFVAVSFCNNSAVTTTNKKTTNNQTSNATNHHEPYQSASPPYADTWRTNKKLVRLRRF